jgi:CheY-like chemotaxis protein
MSTQPRILLVMQRHWPRALILAALNEAGYDATGVSRMEEALAWPGLAPGQGPIRLIILDHEVLHDPESVQKLLQRHPESQALILESAVRPSIDGSYPNTLRYPVSIAEILQAVQQLLPAPVPVPSS